jgi:SOS response regulatory protein OraA/RecX
LSEAQVRTRLEEVGFTASAIEQAVVRLIECGALDDRRAATAIARLEARIRRHGPQRVLARLASMQIERDLARAVVRDLFEEDDESVLIDAALDRRLRGNAARLQDPAEGRKLVAYLVRQGFSPAAAAAAVRNRRKSTPR